MEAAGLAEKPGNKWVFKHIDKKYYTKEVYGEAQNEVFTQEILEKINKFLATKGYSKIDIKIKKEVEEFDENYKKTKLDDEN